MIDFEDFVEQINDCFKHKDVKVRVSTGGGFSLRIEERDIQFDENLKFVGRGTNLVYDEVA